MSALKVLLYIILMLFALPTDPCASEPSQEILNQHFNYPDRLKVKRLSGGLSGSKNYQVTSSDGKEYVFRILNSADSLEARKREVAAAKYAGEKGIGPKIYFISDDDGSILMDFVPGETLSSARLREPGSFSAALETLRALHRSEGALPQGQGICKTIREQLDEARRRGVPLPPNATERALKKLTAIEETFKDQPRVLCHTDLHPLNMIMSQGHVQLIDWTCASLDSPYVDLGSFAILNQVKDPDEMLTLYLGRPPSAEEKRWLQMGQDLIRLRLFASLFPVAESPLRDPTERQKELDQQVWDQDLLPLDHFIELQGQGNFRQEQFRDASLSALKTFLSEESS